MQTLTRRVERQSGIVLCYVDVQADVRIGDRDVRTFPGLLAELVNYSVLNLICNETGVAELFE